MKKAFVIATIIPICIGLGNSALGEQQKSLEKEVSPLFEVQSYNKNFTALIGVKYWFNKWDLPIEMQSDKTQQIFSYDSETESTLIPVLSFKYKNLFVSGSFFPKTDYSFGEQSFDFPGSLFGLYDVEKILVPISISGERSEWDINLGYYLLPTLAVTAGYKRIKRQVSLHIPDQFFPTFSNQEDRTQDALKQVLEQDNQTDGLMLSIASVVPLQYQFGLYGSFAYGWLKTKGDEESVNSKYKLGELGLLYSHRFDQMPALNAASAYLGYRFQFLNDDFSVGNGATDSTEGFVLGVNIVF
ncbi:hypothetical protein PN36_05060 [Candidatus Thiomargarita nelsonii]|uniref:Secreted protein n=1 Tax=Candidatus Thiomargarita nelsonii TaxID=1003181 RepID=A0A0A6P6D8_9GAMM|nr:hypothetical protein PN36_05060 [Candidatus Thiomargarita nelsonii]